MSPEPKSKNITWHGANMSRVERQGLVGVNGCVVWFTGLSGSGKSTLARAVEEILLRRKILAYVLDGDNVRHGLNKDLGFSPEDRAQNIRRIGEVAHLFADACVVTLTAFISPYRKDRDLARALMPPGAFIECYVHAPLEVCEDRDPKGLYKKARAGLIPDFTGISAPYEAPLAPEIVLETAEKNVEECAMEVIGALVERGIIPE